MSAAESLPFDGSPHTISIGLRRLDLSRWIDLETRVARSAEKQVLLDEHNDAVVATIPGSEAGGSEVLELVVDHLSQRALVSRVGDTIVDHESGRVTDVSRLHPLDAAARLVGEDLCLMESGASPLSGYVLTAASVSFPSRWRLGEKIGTSMASIHAPVAHYDQITEATDRFFEALTIERPVHRINWTLIDDPALFQPEPARRAADRAVREAFDDPAHQVHLRIERQTLRRLPTTGGVLFTIATDVETLGSLTAAQRTDLAGSLRGVDAATSRYKGWDALLPAVRRWIEESRE